MTGVTAIEVPDGDSKLIIRSTTNVKESPWVHWVLIEWPLKDFSEGVVTSNRFCYARVHGFVIYKTPDYPTFNR